MAITSLGHVALRCRDIEETIGFYDRLGVPLAYRMARQDGTAGEPVFLKVAPGSFLELFSGGTDEPLIAPRTRPGLVHVCLHVDDIHAFHAGLLAQGIATNGAPQKGRGGNWSFTLTDPNGVGVEIIQLEPGTQMADAAT
ncbi:MAG TPA: VOC family protein [Chloroflexota bacterium]|nr:VOC family protein [Chloroflexota bacterium]